MSGLRATYGPPSTLMWPMSYILSFLNSYFDYDNMFNKIGLIIKSNNLQISLHGRVLS